MAGVGKGVRRTLRAAFDNGLPVRVAARYDTAEPFAVVFQFGGARRGAEWVFDWELLREAVAFCSAGEGDVRFRRDELDHESTWMTLDSPDGHAELVFKTEELWDLATGIAELVPPGGIKIDWDAEVAGLLDGGAV